jgi:hypothetical protein
MITISSITELNEAVTLTGAHTNTKLLKLFVESTSSTSPSSPSTSGNASTTLGTGSGSTIGRSNMTGSGPMGGYSSFMTSVGSIAGSFSFSSPPPIAAPLPSTPSAPPSNNEIHNILMEVLADHTVIACLPMCMRSAYDALMEWQKARSSSITNGNGGAVYSVRELLERILATAPTVMMTTSTSVARLASLLPSINSRLEIWLWRIDPSLLLVTRMLSHDQLPHIADTLRSMLANGFINSMPLSSSSSNGPAAIAPFASSSSVIASSNNGGTTFELSRLMAIFPPAATPTNAASGASAGTATVSNASAPMSSGNYPSLFSSSSPGTVSTPSSSSLSMNAPAKRSIMSPSGK